MDDGATAVLRELLDRQEIHDCLMRYSRGVDRLDPDLIRSAYHDDAIDDHGMFVGTRDEFVDWVIDMHSKTHILQQHCLFNHSCEIDGDVAHTETYYMFAGMNRTGEPLSVSGGRYIDRFERRQGCWAIAQRLCIRDWAPLSEQPDPDDPSTLTAIRNVLPSAVVDFMRTGPRSSRDRSDPSYRRPLQVGVERVQAGRSLH
ncbi:MAG: nuclear transport factor 2 family protein [Rhodococcus qingshengii]